MNKHFESYIQEIVNDLHCSKKEKEELMDEILDHLTLLKNEFMAQGVTEEEAIKKALEIFGEQNHIKQGLQASISPFYKFLKIGTWVLFCVYSFILFFKFFIERLPALLSFKAFYSEGSTGSFYISPNGLFDIETWSRNTNLIPFKNTITYITGSEHYNFNIILDNTLGNMLIFLPLGFFLPILFKKVITLRKVISGSILISFTFEALQFFLQLGQFDIDDIILNTLGSIVGYWVITGLFTLYRNRKKFPLLFRKA